MTAGSLRNNIYSETLHIMYDSTTHCRKKIRASCFSLPVPIGCYRYSPIRAFGERHRPTKNSAATLEKCLQSIKNQTISAVIPDLIGIQVMNPLSTISSNSSSSTISPPTTPLKSQKSTPIDLRARLNFALYKG